MKVPPSESENTIWPIAATMTAGVRSAQSELQDEPAHPCVRARKRQRADHEDEQNEKERRHDDRARAFDPAAKSLDQH